jgi:ribosomal subunit interface protein
MKRENDLRVQIATRHCDVPSDVLEKTEELVAGLSKYSPRASSAEVVYTEEKLTKGAEIIMHIDGGAPLVSKGEGGEFRAALDQSMDRMSRQLRRQRERRTDHKAPPLGEGVAEG